MARTRQIALAFPITVGVSQEIVAGILEYSREHGPWTFVYGSEALTLSVLSLKGWRGDGVIAGILDRRDANAAARLRLPVVDIWGALTRAELPRVTNDYRAIGRLAAEHFLQRGFRRFAYYGLKRFHFANERCEGFADRIDQDGYPCAILRTAGTTDPKGTWHHWEEDLRRWLSPMQRPLAVMAGNDVLARMVIDTCRQMGWHVPHEVAVLGVGNDLLLCEEAQPTLTSVARNGREIGYRAAQLLDRLMSRKRSTKRDIMVTPHGVVARQSTNIVAIDDAELVPAVQYVHDHLNEPFTVEHLVRDVPVSRRWLEYRFRQRLGCSPHEYICGARVERAKQLLLGQPGLRIEQLARDCGFGGGRNLRRAFQRLVGMTPDQYRRQGAAATSLSCGARAF